MTEAFESLYQLVFVCFAVALVLLERVRVLQRQRVRFARRWTSNIGLFLIGSVFTAVVFPIGLYAFAQQQPPGLLARLGLSFPAQILLTFVLLDLWRYWEHRLYHRIPLLWRLHLVHHSDTQIDVTTSERHHPLELLLGTAVLLALIATLGLPAPALGLYLLTATVVALYSHANLRLPAFLDRALRGLIVTPPVHAVHHSDLQAQTDSNYGSVLTIWDRLFGTYVDPQSARIPHFGLGYFHLPKDTGLLRVLQQPFLFRRSLDYPGRDDDAMLGTTAAPPRFAMTRAWRDAILGGSAGCLLVAAVMWPTLLEMTASWRSEPYQYAWLIVPMLVYLTVWNRQSPRPQIAPQPDFTGVGVVVVAAACWGAAALMNIDVGRQFALILSLQGIAISTLGWRAYWRLFPTLALLFLMIPYGDLLQPALRMLTLKSIELFAIAANLPHSIDGFVIFIGSHRYIVLDDCSGLSYVTLATFLGYCFGLLLYRSFFRIAALSLLGAVLGVATNVLRVNAIVLIDWIRDSQMALTAHGTIQWIALFVTLGLLFYILTRLKVDASPAAFVPDAPGDAPTRRKLAPVVAGLSGLLIAGSAAALPANASQPPRGMPSGVLSAQIAGWARADPTASWAPGDDGQTEAMRLTYQREGHDVEVLIITTLSPTAKLPESRLAPGDRTMWREKPVQNEVGCAGSDCIALRHASWERDHDPQMHHVYFTYSIGSFVTNSRFALRAAHGWRRLTGNRDNPRLIGFISDDALDVDELAVAFRAVQSALASPGARAN
ncbi:MAG: exosortase-associated EpsI family protein [Betaproteobacteria bacterium]